MSSNSEAFASELLDNLEEMFEEMLIEAPYLEDGSYTTCLVMSLAGSNIQLQNRMLSNAKRVNYRIPFEYKARKVVIISDRHRNEIHSKHFTPRLT